MSDVLVPVQVILKLFTMTNSLLGYWVDGNVLTDPNGVDFIEALATVIQKSTEVFAWIWGIV
jgi:hypothetical protein